MEQPRQPRDNFTLSLRHPGLKILFVKNTGTVLVLHSAARFSAEGFQKTTLSSVFVESPWIHCLFGIPTHLPLERTCILEAYQEICRRFRYEGTTATLP